MHPLFPWGSPAYLQSTLPGFLLVSYDSLVGIYLKVSQIRPDFKMCCRKRTLLFSGGTDFTVLFVSKEDPETHPSLSLARRSGWWEHPVPGQCEKHPKVEPREAPLLLLLLRAL